MYLGHLLIGIFFSSSNKLANTAKSNLLVHRAGILVRAQLAATAVVCLFIDDGRPGHVPGKCAFIANCEGERHVA